MAMPIKPTPRLTARASEDFIRRVEENLRNPVGLVATPRLKETEEKITKQANGEEK